MDSAVGQVCSLSALSAAVIRCWMLTFLCLLSTHLVALQAKLKASQDKQQLAMEPLKRAFLEQMARSRALLPASDSAPQLGRPPSRAPSNATAEELEDHNISAIVSAVSGRHSTNRRCTPATHTL